MPTYEYGCQGCGATWELQQRISEAAATDCPKCGEAKAKRLISGGNFVLKGGGWYADGYASSSKSGSSSGGGGGGGESSSSSSSSGD